MQNYLVIDKIGAGSFGTVSKAVDLRTCELVAIKKLNKKYRSWDECKNLSEVKALRMMKHPNIVRLRNLMLENGSLYFVFEYMDSNLFQFLKDNQKPLSEAKVRDLCFQVLHGLAYMHECGYFHRDLKPENLLIRNSSIKIADLGSAREIGSQPPYTSYVTTRWYRAPEVMLGTEAYTSKVDMWAVGAIMAELLTFRPLFPGANEADQMFKICRVIGSPTLESWAEGIQFAGAIRYEFPQLSGVNLSLLIPSASSEAISLISSLCSWDPSKRPTAVEALGHPFFQTRYPVPPTVHLRLAVDRSTHPNNMIPSARTNKEKAQACGASELVKRMSNLNVCCCKPSVNGGKRQLQPFP